MWHAWWVWHAWWAWHAWWVCSGGDVMLALTRYDSATSSSLTLSGVGGANTGVGGANTDAGDKLTQMEYLHCYSWQWLPPSLTPAILSALLE